MCLSCLVLAPSACEDRTSPPDRGASAPASEVGPASREDDRPAPTLLLIVIDTLRADAVSAYGTVQGTTPHIDRLASRGLLYRHAYAPAPWTLPSHATLFTGLPPDRHGVGLNGRMALGKEGTTIAEALSRAGYQTVGFSENPLVGPEMGFSRGFGRYRALGVKEAFARKANPELEERDPFDIVSELADWLEQRRSSKPLFLFVNLFEPHNPYVARETNPFVGGDHSRVAIEHAARSTEYRLPLCDALPGPAQLEIMHGLYHGDVAHADEQVGRIVELVRRADPSRPVVTVVTSDHGEHFGEHAMMGHEYSVRNPLLNVPLIVHGLPGVESGKIDTPVELADLHPSFRCWAGLDEACARTLPTETASAAPDARPARDFFAIYSDEKLRVPDQLAADVGVESADEGRARKDCGPRHPVFGRMISLTRYPYKWIWFERSPGELYDLSWDTGEQSDLAAVQPAIAARMDARLQRFIEESGVLRRPEGPIPELSEEAVEALESLGYLEP